MYYGFECLWKDCLIVFIDIVEFVVEMVVDFC